MTDYEIYSFESYRRHQHDDERPVERAAREMMNLTLMGKYIWDRKAERPQFAQMEDAQVNEMLNLTRDGVWTLPR